MLRRSGEVWNDEDVLTLRRMFQAGSTNGEIARTLGQTVAPVATRISTLKRRHLLRSKKEEGA